eukprot:gene6465-3099_t
MSLDFSADGLLVVCGNNRGELSLYSVLHKQLMNSWMAHKRSAITCVKFSHDATQVYSCGLDCKMSQDGLRMMSGDKDGTIILWDTTKHTPTQVIRGAHNGSILSGTISPDGSMIASSGTDEHISIRCGKSGKELAALDDALDGKGLTIKFSFDVEDCLVFEIQALIPCMTGACHGQSPSRLARGADGRANFEVGFRDVETGGFIRADLSSNGSTMVGATAKGHLIQVDNVKQKSAMLGLTTSKLAVACRDGVRTEQLQRSQQWQSFGGLDVSETGAGPR